MNKSEKKYALRIIGILIVISILGIKFKIDKEYEGIVESIYRFEKNKITNAKLEEYIDFMKKINKAPEENILIAYTKINDNKISQAEAILSKNISNFNKYTNIKTRLTSIEVLAKIYLNQGEEDKAINLIKDNFSNLRSKDYKYNVDIILEFMDDVIDMTDANLAIELIEHGVPRYYNLSEKINLKILDKIRTWYILTNNYAKASEASIKSVHLSKKLNDKQSQAESMIELALLFSRLKGYETGIKVIQESLDIEIADERTRAEVEVYAFINLCELYLTIGDYENAEKFSDKIPDYKDNLSEEDYRDIEILKNNMDSEIYVHKNDLKSAKESLDKSLELQKKDKNESYYEKDISYALALGKFYEETGEPSKSKSIYKDLLSRAKSDKNYYLYEKVLKLLIQIEDNIILKNEYLMDLSDLVEYEQDKRYGDYSYNILDKIKYENELIESNNFKLLIYKIIFIFILGLVLFNKKLLELKRRNTHDVLINAYNRRIFDKKYKMALDNGKKFYIMILDLDNFKNINDTYGHQFGDTVLVDTCEVIRSTISRHYQLFRYGGEEFVIISKSQNNEDVLDMAESIRKEIESMTWKSDIKVTVSIGVSSYSDSTTNVLENADKNLYISKKTGKNKVTYN
ncbi:GGDEF domain-containing protein [Romboutsia weinsteinii]|uniref:GGDEF domain-containing protein n=1 Tax=Romboutsia weinsteinii TaxID=2020949 RepID=A0A371J4Y1_9FIRM|nr:GGDEF domain-containing protein [Romboutsia weinsteinii]RDY27737.1 GGDEF domain-containing protein [Romboutsia weinsteinii]